MNIGKKYTREQFPINQVIKEPTQNQKTKFGKTPKELDKKLEDLKQKKEMLLTAIHNLNNAHKALANTPTATESELKALLAFVNENQSEIKNFQINTINETAKTYINNTLTEQEKIIRKTQLFTNFKKIDLKGINTTNDLKNMLLANNHQGYGNLFRTVLETAIQKQYAPLLQQAKDLSTEHNTIRESLQKERDRYAQAQDIAKQYTDIVTDLNSDTSKEIHSKLQNLKKAIESKQLQDYFPEYEIILKQDGITQTISYLKNNPVKQSKKSEENEPLHPIADNNDIKTAKENILLAKQHLSKNKKALDKTAKEISTSKSNLQLLQNQLGKEIAKYDADVSTYNANKKNLEYKLASSTASLDTLTQIGEAINAFSQGIATQTEKVNTALQKKNYRNPSDAIPDRQRLMVTLLKDHGDTLKKKIEELSAQNKNPEIATLLKNINIMVDKFGDTSFSFDKILGEKSHTNPMPFSEMAIHYATLQNEFNTAFETLKADYEKLSPPPPPEDFKQHQNNLHTKTTQLNDKIKLYEKSCKEFEKNQKNSENAIAIYNQTINQKNAHSNSNIQLSYQAIHQLKNKELTISAYNTNIADYNQIAESLNGFQLKISPEGYNLKEAIDQYNVLSEGLTDVANTLNTLGKAINQNLPNINIVIPTQAGYKYSQNPKSNCSKVTLFQPSYQNPISQITPLEPFTKITEKDPLQSPNLHKKNPSHIILPTITQLPIPVQKIEDIRYDIPPIDTPDKKQEIPTSTLNQIGFFLPENSWTTKDGTLFKMPLLIQNVGQQLTWGIGEAPNIDKTTVKQAPKTKTRPQFRIKKNQTDNKETKSQNTLSTRVNSDGNSGEPGSNQKTHTSEEGPINSLPTSPTKSFINTVNQQTVNQTPHLHYQRPRTDYNKQDNKNQPPIGNSNIPKSYVPPKQELNSAIHIDVLPYFQKKIQERIDLVTYFKNLCPADRSYLQNRIEYNLYSLDKMQNNLKADLSATQDAISHLNQQIKDNPTAYKKDKDLINSQSRALRHEAYINNLLSNTIRKMKLLNEYHELLEV